MARTSEHAAPDTSPPAGATPALIRWGAVIGGGVIGLSLLAVLASLWLALAFGTGMGAIEANLDWYLTISAVVSMFVGGLLAGWLAGVPGFAPGLFNGLTVWGVILTVSLLVGTPGALQAVGMPTEATVAAVEGQAIWAGFVAMVVGALAAALGGGLGGITTRPAFVYAAAMAEERRAPAHRDERADDERADDERADDDRAVAKDGANGGRHRTEPPQEGRTREEAREEETPKAPAEASAGRTEPNGNGAERR